MTLCDMIIDPSWNMFIQLPEGARLLTVAPDKERLVLYYLADLKRPLQQRHLRAVSPKTEFPDADQWRLMGAARPAYMGVLWHVFERKPGTLFEGAREPGEEG